MFNRGDKRTDFQVCCPYNPAHQMPQERLIWHITKGCKDKELKAKFFKTCPFNCMHIVHENKYQDHIDKCNDKNVTQVFNKEEQDELSFAIQQQFKNKKKNQNVEEEEPEETVVGGFDQPEVKTKKKRIRKKKIEQQQEPTQDDKNMSQWYEKSYGNHANLLKDNKWQDQELKKQDNDEEEGDELDWKHYVEEENMLAQVKSKLIEESKTQSFEDSKNLSKEFDNKVNVSQKKEKKVIENTWNTSWGDDDDEKKENDEDQEENEFEFQDHSIKANQIEGKSNGKNNHQNKNQKPQESSIEKSNQEKKQSPIKQQEKEEEVNEAKNNDGFTEYGNRRQRQEKEKEEQEELGEWNCVMPQQNKKPKKTNNRKYR